MAIVLKTKVPGPKSIALMAERTKEIPRGPFHASPIFVARGQGAVLEDVDGNRLLDFATGIGVMNVGHGAPSVLAALHDQVDKHLHTSFNVAPYESYVEVCRRLNAAAPGTFSKKSFLANSGAEATENAVKIARAYTKRKFIVAMEHAFHGRTYMAMGLTAKEAPYKAGFGPFPEGVIRVPFPYVYRWPGGGDETSVAEAAFDALVKEIGPRAKEVAAILLEPVLGEGGFLPVPRSFAHRVQTYCREHGIAFVADEIQCGFGRSGHLFASQALGIEPDLLLTAKALGGGVPLSAVTGRTEWMEAPEVGAIGGTFGGNPLACRAAIAVFDLMTPAFLEQVRVKGEWLRSRLMGWKDRFAGVGDVRGMGMMLGVELVKDVATRSPDKERTTAVIRSAAENGVILLSAGTYGNVLRFLPPLGITPAELEEGISVIEKGLSQAL